MLLSTYIPDKLSYLSCTARPTLNPIDTEDSNFTKDGNNEFVWGCSTSKIDRSISHEDVKNFKNIHMTDPEQTNAFLTERPSLT